MQNYTGQTINRYFIQTQLGQGGMAVVYKAYDRSSNRDVGINILRSEAFPEDQQPMTIQHPNIVPLYDFDEFVSVPNLMMAYMLGATLKQRIGLRMPWQEALHLLTLIDSVLTFADSMGQARGFIQSKAQDDPLLSCKQLLVEKGIPIESADSLAATLSGKQSTGSLVAFDRDRLTLHPKGGFAWLTGDRGTWKVDLPLAEDVDIMRWTSISSDLLIKNCEEFLSQI